MKQIAVVVMLASITGLTTTSRQLVADEPVSRVPLAPAEHREPEHRSDARLALFRSEPSSQVLVVELPDARTSLPDEIVALQDEARAGRTPTRNGFRRELPQGLEIDLSAPSAAQSSGVVHPGLLTTLENGSVAWAGSFRAKGAWALRIQLTSVSVPPGARFLVCGTAQSDCTAFGSEAVTERGEIWSPIVSGDLLHLEVTVPSPGPGTPIGGFVPSALMEILAPSVLLPEPREEPRIVGALDTSCMVKGECVSDSTLADLSKYRSAYAHLQFVQDGANYICSGALLNDDGVDGFIPYLLTANHCFATQASASSLVAYFDYRYASCSASAPTTLSGFPKVYGASLLATGAASDFTFLRLSEKASGYRYYLGWDGRTIPSGSMIYRLSHPSGLPQHFTASQYTPSPSTYCSALPTSRFAYSMATTGGTAGGSSGAPALSTGGYVVGQLYGVCGSGDLKDPCDPRNFDVDGAFSSTWSSVSQWLRPTSGASRPVPDFGYSPSSPRVGESVQFTDFSKNGPTAWTWSFGDGSQSTAKNPSHAYSAAGTYTVTLTAGNTAGAASTSSTITISSAPLQPTISYFGANPPAIAAGQSSTITWTSTGGTNAFINQGIGQVPTSGNRTIVPVTGAPYTLTVSGPGGTAQATLTISSVGTTYGNAWIIPSTARVHGDGGAFWTTDVTVMNPESTAVGVNLKFLGHGESGLSGPESTFTLAPKSSRVIQDVLLAEFGLSSDWGPILIRTVTGNVVVQAQTSTPGNGGTYGQSVPAISRSGAIGTSPRAICGIRQDAGYRTNIVLVNLAEQAAQIDLDLLSPTGSVLASRQETLGPLGFRQLNVANDLRISNLAGGTLVLSSKSSLTPFAAYASVIDNRTADPRTLLPQ